MKPSPEKSVDSYTHLAEFYDSILSYVDYESWYRYILSIMIQYAESPRIVLELGCGTGKFGAKFSADGYSIYGIDGSVEMLQAAKMRAFKNYRVFCADIRNFHLAKKPDFIFCVHDTVNYLTSTTDVKKFLSCVRESMNENTIFMMDITTEYNVKKNFVGIDSNFFIRGTEILWHNEYDPDKSRVVSTLTFKKKGSETVEKHIQRLYSINEISLLLASEGFELLDVFGDISFKYPQKDSVMINFIARKSK